VAADENLPCRLEGQNRRSSWSDLSGTGQRWDPHNAGIENNDETEAEDDQRQRSNKKGDVEMPLVNDPWMNAQMMKKQKHVKKIEQQQQQQQPGTEAQRSWQQKAAVCTAEDRQDAATNNGSCRFGSRCSNGQYVHSAASHPQSCTWDGYTLSRIMQPDVLWVPGILVTTEAPHTTIMRCHGTCGRFAHSMLACLCSCVASATSPNSCKHCSPLWPRRCSE